LAITATGVTPEIVRDAFFMPSPCHSEPFP
jgi:hypothetical protein